MTRMFVAVLPPDHVLDELEEFIGPRRDLSPFRWTQPEGELAVEGNSLFVTFALTPLDGGTNVKMTETGFRQMGWSAEEVRAAYDDHVQGWGFFIPRLGEHVATLNVQS